ncbi:MAG TPA: hypothetical protein ENH40_04130 [Nitrospirae bacterium]|nr:hypothetical protein [Nitrospirota bacterium]
MLAYLKLDVKNPDSSSMIITIGHPNAYNCLDPMGYATFGTNADYYTSYGRPMEIQIPGLSAGYIQIPIEIKEDDVAEPDDEAICFELYPGPGYSVPTTYDYQYQRSIIILDDGDTGTGIEERMENTLKVYPTVANEELFVETKKDAGQMEIMIYNVFGQEMKRQTTSETKTSISTATFSLFDKDKRRWFYLIPSLSLSYRL